MSNYNALKATIDANIKQNGRQEITGQILNSVLNQMVTALGAGYQFMGVATPDTNPGTPDAKVFYIANGKGTYTNFGSLEVTEDEVVVLYWDSSWHKVSTGIASQGKLTELNEKVDALSLGAFYGYFPDSSSLPIDVTTPGYAYVGLDNPYKIWNFNGKSWSDSGTSIDMNDADEEDITRNADGKLQFKDRSYGDGMGYVILRKNKTFAEQVTLQNTIYEIRYDFTINGDVTIPANCVLKFDGGSIGGAYRITGNNTVINAGPIKIFNTDVIFDGSWNVDALNIRWFGAKGDGITDDTVAFKNCIESPAVALGGYKILINKGTYVVTDTIFLPCRGIFIAGECREELYYDETFNTSIRFLGEDKELFRIKENTTNISFERLSFRSYYQDGIDYKNNIAIKAMPISTNNPQSSKTIIMRDCNFLGFGYQFYVSGIPEKPDWQCDGELIENCRFTYPAKAGIYINSRNAFDVGLIQCCNFSPKPLEDSRPAYGIEIHKCGYFKVLEAAASSLLAAVSPNSEAAIKTAFCNISDSAIIGNIVFEQIQAESINRTININNISGSTNKLIIFNSCTFDSEVYIKNGPGRFIFNNCAWNSTGKILVDGDNIKLKGVPLTAIQLINGGINSYAIEDESDYRITKTLYIPDLLKISETGGITIDDVVNPCSKTFSINTDDTLMVFPCISVSNPFMSSMAYKVKLFGAYNIGQDGHLQVKLRINSLDIKTLDTLSNSDLINGKFYKEYNICLEHNDPNLLEHAVILDVANVTGQIQGIIEQTF